MTPSLHFSVLTATGCDNVCAVTAMDTSILMRLAADSRLLTRMRAAHGVVGSVPADDVRQRVEDAASRIVKLLRMMQATDLVRSDEIRLGNRSVGDPMITEVYQVASLLRENKAAIIDVIGDCRELGLRIAVDPDLYALSPEPVRLNQAIVEVLAEIEEIGPPPHDYGDAELDAINARIIEVQG